MSARRDLLERLVAKHGVLAIYLFGSRADDGLRLLGERSPTPRREGSDLDAGREATS